MGKGDLSTVRLTVVLAAFFVAGAAMTFFVWYTLSEFLAGRPVEGGQFLLALALSGFFVALAWLMAQYVQRAVDPDGRLGSDRGGSSRVRAERNGGTGGRTDD